MSAQSESEEFIALAEEMFEDGADGVLLFDVSGAYNPETLTTDVNPSTPIPCKVVFIAPQQSTQVEFEQEIKNEDYIEHKVAMVDYRGEVDTGGILDVEGVGRFYITGKIAVNPLGITIFHRLKVSR